MLRSSITSSHYGRPAEATEGAGADIPYGDGRIADIPACCYGGEWTRLPLPRLECD